MTGQPTVNIKGQILKAAPSCAILQLKPNFKGLEVYLAIDRLEVGRPRKKSFKKIKKKPKKKFQGCLAQNDIRPEFHVRPKKASTCPVKMTGAACATLSMHRDIKVAPSFGAGLFLAVI